MLPAGAILVGGGANLPGIVDLAKEELRLPVSLGTPGGARGLTAELEGPEYAAPIGLVLWAADNIEPSSGRPLAPALAPVGGRLKRWVKNFLP